MKYKLIFEFFVGCMILLITAEAQIPSWEQEVESFSENHYYYDPQYPPDIEANGSGIHYVFKNSPNGDIRYYLLGSDGSVIESFTLDQGERPAVAAYHNDVYVVYYKQGLFKGKVRTFDGQNWSAWADIQSFSRTEAPEQIDLVMDQRGVRLVWSEGYQVWYHRYDPDESIWTDLKNVSDHPNSPDGRFPTVALSSDRVHISYVGYWVPMDVSGVISRDYQISTSTWHDPGVALSCPANDRRREGDFERSAKAGVASIGY